jgi:hypothetical protein
MHANDSLCKIVSLSGLTRQSRGTAQKRAAPYFYVRPQPMSDAYIEQWRNLRNREWLVIGLFLGYLPGVVGIASVISKFTPSETPVLVVALAWMATFAVTGLRVSFFPCPRCGKHFYMNKYFITTLGRKCPHCGLHRYAAA